MITLVLFHSGAVLPPFLEYNFIQTRLFNPDIQIGFLTDKEHLDDDLFGRYDITPINKDLFYSEKIKRFEGLFNYGANNFWTLAATRLIYIENFLNDWGWIDVYHLENDVLLYYNLEEHHEKFKNLYKNLAITIGGDDKAMTGFLYIGNPLTLSAMTEYFILLLNIYGIDGVKDKCDMDMVNEMGLMRAYGKDHRDCLQNLPILPFGEFSENFNIFNSIFDPASWGQYVGGTIHDKQPGAKPQDHYIGRLLTTNPNYTVIFRKDDEGRNIPYFKYDNNEVKINNLHIHSKNLHKYMSNI